MKELVILDMEHGISSELRTFDSLLGELAEMSNAIEDLTNFSDIIKQFGMTRETLLAADPKRELVRLGIIGSYESLDTLTDTEVQEATEAIGDTIRKLIDGIAIRLSKAKDRIAGIVDGFKNFVADVPGQLEEYKGLINSTTLDTKKLAEKRIRSLPSSDIEMLEGIVVMLTDRKIFTEIETLVKKMVERAKSGTRIGVVSGIGHLKDTMASNKYFTEYNNKVKLLNKEISNSYTFDTLENLGYRSKRDATEAIDLALSTLGKYSEIEKYVSNFYKTQENTIRGVKGLTRFFVKQDTIVSITNLYIAHGHSLSRLLKSLKKILRGTLTMARAVSNAKLKEV